MMQQRLLPTKQIQLSEDISCESSEKNHLLSEIIWCREAGSNRRPLPFQGNALPAELSRHKQQDTAYRSQESSTIS